MVAPVRSSVLSAEMLHPSATPLIDVNALVYDYFTCRV
jgi:hypothetical protein